MSGNGSQGFWPTLSLAERDRRWKAVRAEMAAQGIDCLVVSGDQGNWGGNMANPRYLTGIGDRGFAIFPKEGEPALLTWWIGPYKIRQRARTDELTKTILAKAKKRQKLPNPWRLEAPWIRDLRQAGPLWSKQIIRTIKDFGYERGAIGMVGTSQDWEPEGLFPYTTLQNLRKGLPRATIVEDVTWIIEKQRLRKSPEEVACHQKAAEIADVGIETIKEVARAGVSELKVYSAIVQRMLEAGSERYLMIFWESGPTPTHVALYQPLDRPLLKGDLICDEITPRYAGYIAHPHQPVCVGKPLKEYQQMFELLKRVFLKAMEVLKPGVTVGQIEDILTVPLREKGYSYVHCPFHGLGLSGLEQPTARFGSYAPMVPSPRRLKFEEGMVIALEPMISTGDQKIGIPLGDTVVVTADGCRGMSRYARDIIIV